ncbi:MAG TPA: hypothetical protein PLE71_17935 [Flavobacteriales bacterium]|jgi:hypothetical protein|nr:hypothetical protein [Flavobacteriales bacterium]HRA18729.1 hypothetical protein [Flavobacteriales bacterium]
MKADIITPNYTVYSVSKVDVRLGETFTIKFSEVPAGLIQPFSNNDQVLKIENGSDGPEERTIIVTATTEGESKILMLDEQNKVVEPQLRFTVYSERATSMSATFGEPELK